MRNVGAQRGRRRSCACRKEKGEYTDFYDFLRKVDAVVCNKRTIESLIKAGAFDSLGHTRKGLLAVHADAIDAYVDVKRNEAVGQFDLFGAGFGDAGTGSAATVAMPTIGDSEWDKRDLLAFEREMLGLYVSDHPLFGLEHVLGAAADTTIAALAEEGAVPDGQVVTLAGILSGVQRRITKQGRAWASATLEDLDGAVEVLFFPNTYELVGQYIAEDAIVVVKGRVDRRDDTPRIMAMDMSMPDVSRNPDEQAGHPDHAGAPAARRRWWSELKEMLVQPPRRRRGARQAASTAAGPRLCGWARSGSRRRTALMGRPEDVLGPSAVL